MTMLGKWLSVALLALALTACNQPKPEPEIASSAPHPLYAESFPQQVDATVAGFADGQVKVKELSQGFSKYPGELEGEVDHAAVAEMFEQADQVGKSHAYVDGIEDVAAAAKFFEEEQDEISKKVAGAAQYTAKQAGCEKEAEVGGAAVSALKKIVKERLEERLRDANDAHRLLARHEEALGKKNTEMLERQLDEVTLASYVAHIEMVEHKVRLRRMIEEAQQVKKTADELIDAETEYQKRSGLSDADKKASSERIAAMKRAKAGMDTAVNNAKRISEEMEKRIEQTQKSYEEAHKKLVDAHKAKTK